MHQCLISLGILTVFPAVTALGGTDLEERISEITEGTKSLEDQFSVERCEEGDLLACLRLSGLDCEMPADVRRPTICSAGDRPIYSLTLDLLDIRQGELPGKWIIEVLSESSPAPDG